MSSLDGLVVYIGALEEENRQFARQDIARCHGHLISTLTKVVNVILFSADETWLSHRYFQVSCGPGRGGYDAHP